METASISFSHYSASLPYSEEEKEEEEEEKKKKKKRRSCQHLTVFAVSPIYVPYPAVVDACRLSNEINAALE